MQTLMDSNLWILATLGGIFLVQLFVYLPVIRSKKRPDIQEEILEDPATGLMSLDRFKRILEEELRRGGRYHYPLTLCHVDLDPSKKTNSAEIKNLRREFSQILKGTSRFADGAARYQKNEFCVLLPHTDSQHAEKFLVRLQQEVAKKMDLGFSAGITGYQAGENASQFLMRARTALIQAKEEGQCKIRSVSPEISSAISS